jgi:hypothetical protein
MTLPPRILLGAILLLIARFALAVALAYIVAHFVWGYPASLWRSLSGLAGSLAVVCVAGALIRKWSVLEVFLGSAMLASLIILAIPVHGFASGQLDHLSTRDWVAGIVAAVLFTSGAILFRRRKTTL